ncbi:MAG: flagellar biosynthetic protein FliR [Lachnospiraceae bacterium]
MFILFALIVMRMSGAIALNPVFGRSNLPAFVKSALVLVISLMLYIGFGGTLSQQPSTMIEFGVMLIKELLFGFTLGFGMELSLLVVRFATSVMDYAMGLNMAQVYDPQSNTQMTITSGIYNAFMMLLFFATDGHVRLLGIFVGSAVIIPFGTVTIRPELAQAILAIFQECIVMGLQFAFPLVAMELVAETAVGILMRIVPQINVFVVNFQIKIIVGLLMLISLFSPMADKLNSTMNDAYRTIEHLITLMRY